MRRILFLSSLLLTAAVLQTGCFRQDIKTVTFKVPNMKSVDCSKVIQGALSRIEGIVSAEPDIQGGMIAVTYNAEKLGIKNIEYLIAGLGFDVNDTQGKPDAKANLPAECR